MVVVDMAVRLAFGDRQRWRRMWMLGVVFVRSDGEDDRFRRMVGINCCGIDE